MDLDSNIEQVILFIIYFLSKPCFNNNLYRNLVWHLLCVIISCSDKIIIISVAVTTYFVYLSFKKYSSIIKFHVLSDNNFICEFIISIARLIALDWSLDQYQYLLFSCIWLNNEHPLSFFDVIWVEVNLSSVVHQVTTGTLYQWKFTKVYLILYPDLRH